MRAQLAYSNIKKSGALILAGIVSLLGAEARSRDSEPAPTKDHPLLELNLRQFGYDTSSGMYTLHKFVDFTDSSTLALAWLTLDEPTEAKKKISPLTPRPAHMHTLVLDAKTGKREGPREWPTPSTPVQFSGVRNGQFLICTGSVVRLLSSTLEVIRERSLQGERACESLSFWRQGVSPSRRFLLLSSRSGQNYQITQFDLETFDPVARWSEKLEALVISDISDHWLVGVCGKSRQMCVRRIGEIWRPFQPTGLDSRLSDPRRASAVFLSDDTLVIKAWNLMGVAKVDGSALFQAELPKKKSFWQIVPSAGGERFAIMVSRQRGLTSPTFDMYAFPSNDRVVVYSVPDRSAIYAVKVKGASPWPPWKTHPNQIALSPDGNLLAIITDGILRVYRLPSGHLR